MFKQLREMCSEWTELLPPLPLGLARAPVNKNPLPFPGQWYSPLII